MKAVRSHQGTAQVPNLSSTVRTFNTCVFNLISFPCSRIESIRRIQNFFVARDLIPTLFKLMHQTHSAIQQKVLALFGYLLFNANRRVQDVSMNTLTRFSLYSH